MLGTYEFHLTSVPRNSHLKGPILKATGLTRIYLLLAFLFVLDEAIKGAPVYGEYEVPPLLIVFLFFKTLYVEYRICLNSHKLIN